MGSAILAELSRRGQRVLGLDRYSPPHAHGSSHGETRVIREAYFEHPQYVPLVQRAYERWAELEALSGTQLFVQTGGLNIGAPDSVIVQGALQSAQEHGLSHEILDADQIHRDHPALRVRPDWVAIREARAGVLFPERCIEAHLSLARNHGAEIRTGVQVEEVSDCRVRVEGQWIVAGQVVISAGPWLRDLLPISPVEPSRQVLHWFGAGSAQADVGPDRLPIYIIERGPEDFVYGFPQLAEVGAGVKVARHHGGPAAHPDTVHREATQEDLAWIQERMAEHLPRVDGPLLRSSVCLYTNTADQDFLLDWAAGLSGVLVVSPCSGHGFKFASAFGEVAADLLTLGESRFDLRPFRWHRPSLAGGTI